MAAKDYRVITLKEAFERFPADEVLKKMWALVTMNNLVVGMRNDYLDSEYVQHAMVDEAENELKYIFPLYTEPPAPMIVPIKKVDGTVWTKTIQEWRPVVPDIETGKLGVLIEHSIVGGFGKILGKPLKEARGKSPDEEFKLLVQHALYQALSEAGLKLDEKSIVHLGAFSPNKAYMGYLIHAFAAEVSEEVAAQPEKLESIIGTGPWIPLHTVKYEGDGTSNNAIALARAYYRDVDSVLRFEALMDKEPEAAVKLLEAMELLTK